VSSQKENIYNTAAILFRDKGYKATSMRELATAVGLEASSLYSHIKSKEEILQKICVENAERFTQKMAEVDASDISVTEKMKVLISYHVKVAIEDVTSVTIFNNEWRNLSEPHLSQFLDYRRNYEQKFMTLIQNGMKSGEFAAMDATVAFYMIFTSIRWIHYWYKPDRHVNQEDLVANVNLMIFNGLGGEKVKVTKE
jgi:AcrR family transcriptional regulator